MTSEIHVSDLVIYPVKSCRGVASDSAVLTPRGLAWDRQWMIVDGDGRFVTQRVFPRLALVSTAVGDGALELSVPGGGRVSVPLEHAGDPIAVPIWRDNVVARTQPKAASELLSDFIGERLRLVRFGPEGERQCNPDFAKPGDQTAFADAYPVLVVSQSSLDRLNETIGQNGGEPVPMDRFRGNIVIAGAAADEEDRRQRLTIDGRIAIDLVKPCDRCAVPTVNQATGERTLKEPLASLAQIRRGLLGEGDTAVYFGQNGVPRLDGAPSATISVGDAAAFT